MTHLTRGFELSETDRARMLVVDRPLQSLIDRADVALNREVFNTSDLLTVVLNALGVPPGNAVRRCRRYLLHRSWADFRVVFDLPASRERFCPRGRAVSSEH